MNKQVTIYDALGKQMPRVVQSLPDWVDPERFRRTVFWLMQSNPALEKMQPKSIVDGCMKAAMDGLLLDGKEAALIPHQGVARYSPMIGGLMKLARRSKQFRAIHVHPVYENDHIEVFLGDQPRIDHRPIFGERGALIGAYCIVEMEGGWREYEVMSAADIAKVRKASPSSNSPAWRDWEDQMACKAVFRRLWKRLSHDVEQLSTAIDRETEAYVDEPPIKDVTPKADTQPAAGEDSLAIPPQFDRRQKQPKPEPEPQQDNAGTIPPGVAEMLEVIGEPNADRDSWDQWLVKDVMPIIGDDIGPERADDFIAALQHTMEANGLSNWGAPIFEDWREAVRECFASATDA